MPNRITNFLNKLFPSSEPVTTATVTTLKLIMDKQSGDRYTITDKSRNMYSGDGRVRSSIQMMARDMSKQSIQIKVENSARAQRLANDLVKRIKLYRYLYEWCWTGLVDGDVFLWTKINSGSIQFVQKMPTLFMVKNVNEFMQFDDPKKAYSFVEYQNYLNPNPVKDFTAFEIIHAKWDDDSNRIYGTPLFWSSVNPFVRAIDGENDMYVKRRTRAGARYVHTLEGASEPALEEYKEKHKALFNNPLVAISDFFTNTKGGIQLIEPTTRFDDIADVQHHIETFLTSSPVPSSVIGYGDKVSRDVLVAQQLRYDLTVDHITETWVIPQLIEPLLEREWLLNGLLPENIDWQVYWRYRVILSPEELQQLADAVLRLRAAGFTEKLIAKLVARYVPNMTVEELEKNINPIDMTAQPDGDLTGNGNSAPRNTNVASTKDTTGVGLEKK